MASHGIAQQAHDDAQLTAWCQSLFEPDLPPMMQGVSDETFFAPSAWALHERGLWPAASCDGPDLNLFSGHGMPRETLGLEWAPGEASSMIPRHASVFAPPTPFLGDGTLSLPWSRGEPSGNAAMFPPLPGESVSLAWSQGEPSSMMPSHATMIPSLPNPCHLAPRLPRSGITPTPPITPRLSLQGCRMLQPTPPMTPRLSLQNQPLQPTPLLGVSPIVQPLPAARTARDSTPALFTPGMPALDALWSTDEEAQAWPGPEDFYQYDSQAAGTSERALPLLPTTTASAPHDTRKREAFRINTYREEVIGGRRWPLLIKATRGAGADTTYILSKGPFAEFVFTADEVARQTCESTSRYYTTTRPSETVSAIAKKHGLTAQALVNMNMRLQNISTASKFKMGTHLCVAGV